MIRSSLLKENILTRLLLLGELHKQIHANNLVFDAHFHLHIITAY